MNNPSSWNLEGSKFPLGFCELSFRPRTRCKYEYDAADETRANVPRHPRECSHHSPLIFASPAARAS
ncbi:hypothetical protein ACLOJK_012991 [Asimina triloba]